MIGRRGFITGLISLVAAPAIVRAGSLMPVKQMIGMDFGRSVTLIDGGIDLNRMILVSEFFQNEMRKVLEIDRAIVDRMGPEYRHQLEQEFAHSHFPEALLVRPQ